MGHLPTTENATTTASCLNDSYDFLGCADLLREMLLKFGLQVPCGPSGWICPHNLQRRDTNFLVDGCLHTDTIFPWVPGALFSSTRVDLVLWI